MGYDSKLFIVEKVRASYAINIAEYEICNFYPIREFFAAAKPIDRPIYIGGEMIDRDKYGNPLMEASIADVIACLENLSGEDSTYRRVYPLLGLLKGFQETKEWDENTVVIHYGH